VLDELDKELECRGHQFVRYADDLRIFMRSEKAAQRVMESVVEFIENRLRLRVNRDKSQVCKGVATNFLGHSFLNNGTLILSKTSEKRFKGGLKKLTRRRRGISLEQLLKEVNQKIRGWLYYFRYAQMKSRLQALVSWLQHRIRCFRLKQCKRAIGIVRFLKKLKVPEWRCWLVALSGKGWWRLSGTPQAHESMNNKWFNETGLFDLTKNYLRLKFEETAVYASMPGGVRGQ
jgi:RNA-directed DNA polymerase